MTVVTVNSVGDNREEKTNNAVVWTAWQIKRYYYSSFKRTNVNRLLNNNIEMEA